MMTVQPFKNQHIFQSVFFTAKALPFCLSMALMGWVPAPAQVTAPPPSLTPSSSSSVLKIESGSQKIPAGTMLTVAFNTTMDSRVSNVGDPFHAYLTEDFTVKGDQATRRVVLPAGTTVRGRIQEVKRPSFFSRGGAIFLSFDHVVVPSGELLPLTLNLSTENTLVNKQGALYTDPGIGKKVQKGVELGKQTFEDIASVVA